VQFGRKVRRRRGGGIEIRLSPQEREVMTQVVGQLRDAMLSDADDPALRRLFPPAYVDDEEKEAGFKALARDELLESRLQSIDVVERSAAADTLGADEAEAWLRAMNALRLVLGTRLDVSEDDVPELTPDDPDLPAWVLYDLLSRLVWELVEAMAADLPPGADEP
jgi:hypothetical protein